MSATPLSSTAAAATSAASSKIVRPQAVDRSLTGDVVALYNHDPGAVLGPHAEDACSSGKTIAAWRYDLRRRHTQAGRDALELVGRGDLRGASFGFRTMQGSLVADGGMTVRELLDIEIPEISSDGLSRLRRDRRRDRTAVAAGVSGRAAGPVDSLAADAGRFALLMHYPSAGGRRSSLGQ